MSEQDNRAPWKPEPIPAQEFHQSGEWANINRAPYDQVAGVIYKRAMNIKEVAHTPLNPGPDMPALWQGQGTAIVRWLFSEQRGTEEQLLEGATFLFLHDLQLLPKSSTGEIDHPTEIHILYIIAGYGMLYHRPTDGPAIARPLRPGDAALIQQGENYSVKNDTDADIHLLVLGLQRSL